MITRASGVASAPRVNKATASRIPQFLILPAAVLFLLWAALSATPDRSARAANAGGGWGTVKGRVVWSGDDVPAPKEIDLKDNKDAPQCLVNGKLYAQDWVVDPKTKGIRYAFVWLKSEPPPEAPNDFKWTLPVHPDLQKPSEQAVEMDQPCCQFEPHALGMRQGQTLVVKNSATVLHNVNWSGNPLRNPGGNQALPPKGSLKIADLKADRLPVRVTCNIHPWMKAWVGVFNHPYFAVTEADGGFEIPKVPAGKVRVVVWQESTGYRGGAAGRNGDPVLVRDGQTTDVGELGMK